MPEPHVAVELIVKVVPATERDPYVLMWISDPELGGRSMAVTMTVEEARSAAQGLIVCAERLRRQDWAAFSDPELGHYVIRTQLRGKSSA